MSANRFDLGGRTALVTGGSKGIGKAVARAFVEAGARVMISARHEEELAATAAEIGAAAPERIVYRVADMTRRPQVLALAREAEQALGHVDILVANAGANLPQPLESLTEEAWDRLLELNLSSAVLLARELVPGMKAHGWGRILYMASIMALVGAPGRTAYCATKGALVSLARAQAAELGPHGITVNCISPGPIATELPLTVFTEEQRAAFAAATALGRWGETDEVAGPALLLASEAGSYVTGANLVVDGGCTAMAFRTG